MSNFSTIYKKTFKQILYPQGYKSWKRFFYKETDSVCYFIQANKVAHTPRYDMSIDIIPYCADLMSNEYEPPEGYDIAIIYKAIASDVVASKGAMEFFKERFNASDDEATLSSLDAICNDMEDLILPYIHKFEDLDFCFDGLLGLRKAGGCKSDEQALEDYILYGLALKLHKYKNAFPYVDFRLLRNKEILEQSSDNQAKLRNRDLIGTMDSRWSLESREKLAKSILRRQPDFFESQIRASEETIANSEKRITQLKNVKEALLLSDSNYLDKLVAETEESSREYIRKMING